MLAPMAGFTDRSFRRICREHGVEYTVSEMVSAKALCYEQIIKKGDEKIYKTAPLARVIAEELPMAIQLFGSEPEYVARAAAMIEQRNYKFCYSDVEPTAIDINMGCPMHKIVGNGEGSALMKDPCLAARIVEETVKALDHTPVTVKIRAGWDDSSKNAAEVARAVSEAGASLICVHARTREQMYNPGIDLSIIESVKNAVNIPVIGNGDIKSAKDAVYMMDQTGCDGVMIGRGALGEPWIFEEIAAGLEGRDYTPPTLNERLDVCLEHIKLMREHKGEHVGAAEIKKHAALYVKGMRGAASVRDEIMKCKSTVEIETIIKSLKA
ncbi:MAG: tRNA dihydrouridine synthase DusB [Clostridia bacterium]|nr:tRNA dihydrouridine synthase DusB [Clostridia bacterium]